MKHSKNVSIVSQFLQANPDKGFSYSEIAKQTGVSLDAVKNIIRELKHRGIVDRFIQKERKRVHGGRIAIQSIAYFAWRTGHES